MPPPMTFDTTIAAASTGPRLRTSDAPAGVPADSDAGEVEGREVTAESYRVKSWRLTGVSSIFTHCWEPYLAKISTVQILEPAVLQELDRGCSPV